jgi:hypothetical protein
MKRTEPAGMPAATSASVTGCRMASMTDRRAATRGHAHVVFDCAACPEAAARGGVSAAQRRWAAKRTQAEMHLARTCREGARRSHARDNTRARRRRSCNALCALCTPQRLRARAARRQRVHARPKAARERGVRANARRRQLRARPQLAPRKHPPRRRRCRQPATRRRAIMPGPKLAAAPAYRRRLPLLGR